MVEYQLGVIKIQFQLLGIPTLIYRSLINGCLQDAKKRHQNCCVVFLEISKAFDSVGHIHILLSLKKSCISDNLYKLIQVLLVENNTKISANIMSTIIIPFNCDVPQGSPLSPLLCNLAIDCIMQALIDIDLSQKYGYSLHDSLPNLSAFAFADDTAIVSKNEAAAISLVDQAECYLASIGLRINANKSK